MTQTDRVIELLKNNPTLTNKQIAKKLNILEGNVRRITSTQTKKGSLQRVVKGSYKFQKDIIKKVKKIKKVKRIKKVKEIIKEEEIIEEKFIYRHYISALFYCSGKLKPISIETYKEDNQDIFIELVQILKSSARDNCGETPMVKKGRKADDTNAKDFGYAIELIPFDDSNFNAIYPDYEIGR